jgi:hypothetical protein
MMKISMNNYESELPHIEKSVEEWKRQRRGGGLKKGSRELLHLFDWKERQQNTTIDTDICRVSGVGGVRCEGKKERLTHVSKNLTRVS